MVLASRIVGPHGRVIGVDLSPDMIRLATANVERYNAGGNGDRCGEASFVCAALDDGGEDVWTAVQEALRVGGSTDNDVGCMDDGSGSVDYTVDVVISNGVINLCEHKKEAFQLAYRCLTKGCYFLLSDLCKIDPTTITEEDIAISCTI